MKRGFAVDPEDGAALNVDGVRAIVTPRMGAANDPAFFATHTFLPRPAPAGRGRE